jgi:hypothetical protein
MFSKLHSSLGTAGLVIAVVAVVAALTGGAYAATGGLTAKQKKEVEKIANKVAKPGPAGPQGLQGAKGDAGAAGAAGKDGANGTNGTNGSNGKSVVIGNSAPGCGAAGGKTIEVAGEPATKQNVCNGQTGFTETLPTGKTETGTWVVGPYPKLESYPGKNTGVRISVSFSIPLASEPTPHLILANGKEFNGSFEEVTSTTCTGSVTAPTAEPGNFCLYAQTGSLVSVSNPTGTLFLNPSSGFVNPETAAGGVSKAGVLLEVFTKETNGAEAFGTWAVTGE